MASLQTLDAPLTSSDLHACLELLHGIGEASVDGEGEIEAFDRHFHEHPLVREHGRNPRAVTQRISDLVPPKRFRQSALFDEYYRPIGIDHTMAVPIHVDAAPLGGFVVNRSGCPPSS